MTDFLIDDDDLVYLYKDGRLEAVMPLATFNDLLWEVFPL